ncbi:MAG: diacylglycerol kinase family protein [Anaerolineae bacterium]|nr:diacylglycerol kinase family protein [Anaerolineae bacterium]MBN8617692.1 diacylglycerol kinase family protein [Anaerolineae bacterium]
MTPRTKQVLDALTSTMKINPDQYSLITSPNRVQSLGYAIAGWLYMLRYQKNTRIMSVASIVVFGVAFWLQVDALRWAILVLTITAVWMAEFLNAGVEAVVNLASPDFHPMAKVAKDVAAAAVLLGAVASVLVGLLVLGPPLIAKLGM